MADAADSPQTIEFGRFTVIRHRRELLVDGRATEVGGRVFDTLLALLDAHGAVLSKDELMSRVWPDRVVEENNLHGQISELRKVFGSERDLIRTVAGRGYQFTGEVRATAATAVASAPSPVTNLPEAVSELIGRETELGEVAGMVTEHRLVTLIGAGGIGKTRLGLEVARHLLPRFPDGVFLAELGPLSSPELVPATVATALGLTHVVGTVSYEGVAAAMGSKKLLVVLDNCEHVIEAAAGMAEALLCASPVASLLATSREPLRASGEYIYRVPSLAVPSEDNQDLKDVFRYGGVRLFVSRAHEAEPHYVLEGRLAAETAAICRRLDGIPLAIELAAACVPTFGVEGIAARLGDRFRLLTGGRRTALPRHQTLRATLDWSYDLLTEPERITLRRLAVFAGGFSLEAATAVVASPELLASAVPDCLAGLVGRSLVSAYAGEPSMQYRLLETTRTYALEKLTESGEFQPVARRHAEYYRDLLERAEAEWEIRPTAEWLGAYARHTDNMRAALDWAFSSSGDAAVGVALTAAAVPLWFQQSLMLECRGRVERALASLEPGSGRGDRREMRLLAALGASLMQTKGPAPDTTAAWAKALEIAERLSDIEYQLRALWGLWHFRVSRGECRAALIQAEKFCERVASTANPAEILVGRRMIAVSLHYLGEQTNARRHLEDMLAHYVAPAHRSHAIRFQYDQRVATRMMLARILWLQGFPDQALRLALDNVENARAIDHAMSLCYALEAASLVALWAGNRSAAERSVATLLEHSARHALTVWHARGRCLNGVLLIKHGDGAGGVRLLRASLDELSETGFVPHHTALLGTLAEGLSGLGQVSQGVAVIAEALARSERDEELWCIAELSRIKGEIVLQTGAPNAAATAERLFRQSIDLARRQDALSLELRAATSLARLWHGQRRGSEARKLLSANYRRFTEGFGTADLITAKALLDTLRP
jgi:predicted ATPase/DNA-binding winged helix-turn-helix (wHTH) protein